jgi:hypothetical protein
MESYLKVNPKTTEERGSRGKPWTLNRFCGRFTAIDTDMRDPLYYDALGFPRRLASPKPATLAQDLHVFVKNPTVKSDKAIIPSPDAITACWIRNPIAVSGMIIALSLSLSLLLFFLSLFR